MLSVGIIKMVFYSATTFLGLPLPRLGADGSACLTADFFVPSLFNFAGLPRFLFTTG